ncbi:NmrA family NAD(P)-binding protein [Micromonospora sp. NPDC023737]|uniref:NmrA family NAD(P)-binding protein n=1 Tax=unclassified Micromonospora TaxID=2617518 RepID=UPI0033EC1537
MNDSRSYTGTSARHVEAEPDLFVVTASTSATGSAVARALLDGGSTVVAVGREHDRLRPYADSGALTYLSALDDPDRLTALMANATGAFVMIAPGFIPDSPDFQAYQRAVIAAEAHAVQTAHRHGRLRRVVTLSGWAANYGEARGPVWGLRQLEQAIDATGVPAVHLRAGSFMENLLPDIAAIRATGATGGLIPPDLPLPMIATVDVGRVAGEFLRGDRPFTPGPVEVVGPADRTLTEATRLIGAAIGVREARYDVLTADAVRAGLKANGFSDHMAAAMVDMTLDVAERRIRVHRPEGTITTATTLEEFVRAAVTAE